MPVCMEHCQEQQINECYKKYDRLPAAGRRGLKLERTMWGLLRAGNVLFFDLDVKYMNFYNIDNLLNYVYDIFLN